MNPRPSPTKSKSASPAVVLLSGGLDSTTVLAVARSEGFDVSALTFSYGQRHSSEVDAARRIARSAGVVRHQVVDIDLSVFGGSALTADIPVPKDRDLEPSLAAAKEIPVTYVPARNTIFLSYALALAEVVGSSNIFIGVNALDYSGYPDCRPEYIQAFERMANLATRAGVEGSTRITIRTALISLTKSLAVECAPDLVVNCLAPGWVDTEMSLPAFGQDNRDRIRRSIPLLRIATAEDIAGPILFLCSDLARHVTGEVLNVNGGSVLCG